MSNEKEFWYKNDQTNPCNNCGVCCSHFRISFYQGELKSLGGVVPDELVVSINPTMVAMKNTECGYGKCVGLVDGKCSIYDERPSVCRLFPAVLEDGSINPKCIELKRIHKLSN